MEVAFSQSKLVPSFAEDHPVILKQGETRELGLWLLNAGETAIQEIWVLAGSEHEVWLGNEGDDVTSEWTIPGFSFWNSTMSLSVI